MTLEVITKVAWPKSHHIGKRLVTDTLTHVIKKMRVAPRVAGITVVFISPKEIQRLNLMYRGKNMPTDILSFTYTPLEQGLNGELLICPAVIAKQARAHGVSVPSELCLMLVHGVLHLLGYDHETARQARIMEPLQRRLFESLA